MLVASGLVHIKTAQIFAVNFDDPADCLAKFRASRWLGWILFIGIILGRVLAGRLAG